MVHFMGALIIPNVNSLSINVPLAIADYTLLKAKKSISRNTLSIVA